MDKDDVIKRIIVLVLLLVVLPASSTDLTKLLNLIGYLIILLGVIFLAMTQIDVLSALIPDVFLEKLIWFDIFVSAIIVLVIRLLLSIA